MGSLVPSTTSIKVCACEESENIELLLSIRNRVQSVKIYIGVKFYSAPPKFYYRLSASEKSLNEVGQRNSRKLTNFANANKYKDKESEFRHYCRLLAANVDKMLWP